MPIYEYRCRECAETVEKIQSQAKGDIPCPVCGGKAERSVSAFSAAGQNSSGGGCTLPPGSGFG